MFLLYNRPTFARRRLLSLATKKVGRLAHFLMPQSATVPIGPPRWPACSGQYTTLRAGQTRGLVSLPARRQARGPGLARHVWRGPMPQHGRSLWSRTAFTVAAPALKTPQLPSLSITKNPCSTALRIDTTPGQHGGKHTTPSRRADTFRVNSTVNANRIVPQRDFIRSNYRGATLAVK